MIRLEELYTAKTLAEKWGCTEQHINQLRRRGELVAVAIGTGAYRYEPKEIQRYIDAHRTERKAA